MTMKFRRGDRVYLRGATDKPTMTIVGRQLDMWKLNSQTLLCVWRAPNGRKVHQHFPADRLAAVTGLAEREEAP